MDKNNPTVVLKKDHVPGCTASTMVGEYAWYSPWWIPHEPTFYGDRIGGRRGMTTNWEIFRCNSQRCDAWGLVRQIKLEDFIHDEVEKVRK